MENTSTYQEKFEKMNSILPIEHSINGISEEELDKMIDENAHLLDQYTNISRINTKMSADTRATYSPEEDG